MPAACAGQHTAARRGAGLGAFPGRLRVRHRQDGATRGIAHGDRGNGARSVTGDVGQGLLCPAVQRQIRFRGQPPGRSLDLQADAGTGVAAEVLYQGAELADGRQPVIAQGADGLAGVREPFPGQFRRSPDRGP